MRGTLDALTSPLWKIDYETRNTRTPFTLHRNCLGKAFAVISDRHPTSNPKDFNERVPRPPKCGQLHLILGPMFSGKSTELLRLVERYEVEGNSVLVVKSALDERYGVDSVVTHDGKTRDCVALPSLQRLEEHVSQQDLAQYQVIAIDEAQFFSDLVEFCLEAAEKRGQTVIVAGLSGDFRRLPFGQIPNISALADTVTKLSARCSRCNEPAHFSLRTVVDADTTLVGGSEMYAPACRTCYNALNIHSRE
ncbi:hypothetical protein CYMTET_9577 [Cymbomonas tetramitiformis]|uniref:Thymidine kinase n=1 Tax=Cymbomonas tetramitiformis TaxID=36881 RepID=A0AAE0GSG1_9CHLO|nr:hypothetical protein CYMTET_9577 [Cymbomonas tetramitiformis]